MLEQLEKDIGYKFSDRKYLSIALTHSSYSNEANEKIKNYERLEFLGDSVLSIVTSDYIFRNCPEFPEGELSKLRASLVCEKTLCEFSKSLNVGKYLKLSRGEKRSGGENRVSILADVFESITAAIYLDGGMENARKFVLRFIIPEIKNPKIRNTRDYKTDLQEIVQKNPDDYIEYALVSETGPDHNKLFTVEVLLDSNVIGKGSGKSKKEAEQYAAKEALSLMGY